MKQSFAPYGFFRPELVKSQVPDSQPILAGSKSTAEMVRAGVMENVTEIYGLHLSSNYPTGKIGIKSGIFTAATDKAIITVVGKGGHSAMPELCVDPVVTAAQIVLALQTIISRQISPRDTVVISVSCCPDGGI